MGCLSCSSWLVVYSNWLVVYSDGWLYVLCSTLLLVLRFRVVRVGLGLVVGWLLSGLFELQ